MYLTRKITVRIGAFYSIEELLDVSYKKMSIYMANHGWVEHGGSYNGTYDGFRYTGQMVFVKDFDDISSMTNELEELQFLFHSSAALVLCYNKNKDNKYF